MQLIVATLCSPHINYTKENKNSRAFAHWLTTNFPWPQEPRDKVISAPAKSEKGSSEIQITGELYLTLEYCQENRVFTVHIHTANNLAVVDNKRKTSDPYVYTPISKKCCRRRSDWSEAEMNCELWAVNLNMKESLLVFLSSSSQQVNF